MPLQFRSNPWTVIDNGQFCRISRVQARIHIDTPVNPAGLYDGIDTVAQQVDNHLFHLDPVDNNVTDPAIPVKLDPDVRVAQLATQQIDRTLDKTVKTDLLALQVTLADELAEMPDDIAGAMRLFLDPSAIR